LSSPRSSSIADAVAHLRGIREPAPDNGSPIHRRLAGSTLTYPVISFGIARQQPEANAGRSILVTSEF
jgi:hypothetical protein